MSAGELLAGWGSGVRKQLSGLMHAIHGFFRVDKPQSMTRLVMFVCTVTACLLALGSLAFAFKNPTAVSMVATLGGIVLTLSVKAVTAIKARSKDALTPDEEPKTP